LYTFVDVVMRMALLLLLLRVLMQLLSTYFGIVCVFVVCSVYFVVVVDGLVVVHAIYDICDICIMWFVVDDFVVVYVVYI